MRRLFVVVLAAMSLSGCSAVTARLMERSAKPKPATLDGYVCAGDEVGWTDYLGEFPIERYQALDALQASRRRVAERIRSNPAECPAAQKSKAATVPLEVK